MKQNLFIISAKTVAALLLVTLLSLGLTACSNDDDDNPAGPDNPSAQAEYAILFYAYGGSTLDQNIMQNMLDFYKGQVESYDKVKIAAQYKYSSIEDIWSDLKDKVAEGIVDQDEAEQLSKQLEPMGLQTIRFVVDPAVNNAADDVLMNPEYIYGQMDCSIASVDSLTNFINWATEACPAKHYVLILSDHGGGYIPSQDLTFKVPVPTRGVLFDDSGRCFTASSLEYALERAKIRMDVIYLDACLMNTIEYQFELKDCADYLILSTFTVPDAGGSYDVLVDELAKNTSDLETALKNFNKATVERWDKDAAAQVAAGNQDSKWDYHDLTVTRTKNLNAFGVKFREFVDKLLVAYADESNKAKIDTATRHAFKVNNSIPSYDLVDYTESIFIQLPNVFDAAFTKELATSFNSCLVSQYCSDFLMQKDLSVDCSIMLAVKGNYYVYYYSEDDLLKPYCYYICYADGKQVTYWPGTEEEPFVDKWPSTLKDTYEQLAFDKATGWSRWLYLNEQVPCPNSPVEMHYPLGY